MGMLSDKMNADFNRRIEIAKRLGLKVHGPEMMALQVLEKVGGVTVNDLCNEIKRKKRIDHDI